MADCCIHLRPAVVDRATVHDHPDQPIKHGGPFAVLRLGDDTLHLYGCGAHATLTEILRLLRDHHLPDVRGAALTAEARLPAVAQEAGE